MWEFNMFSGLTGIELCAEHVQIIYNVNVIDGNGVP
jgi:hypothetical protein